MNMSEDQKISIDDQCPSWANELILKLREVEILLGNVPAALAWQSQHVKEISKRSFAGDDAVFDEEKTEFIYRRIVWGLVAEKHSVQDVASFFNQRIGYEGGPVYTNLEEVHEAL